MIETVLGNALNLALIQETEDIVPVTEEMFIDAEKVMLELVKHRVGFAV